MPKKKTSATAATLAAVPVALSLLAPTLGSPTPPGAAPAAAATSKSGRGGGAAKEFSVPIANLQTWAKTVVVALDNVTIDDHSKVHKLADDCELHFGGKSTAFQGVPDGLVLEPMNVCVQPFDTNTQQSDADWTNFADGLKGKTVSVTGVPRIWPEHLIGGTLSNPDHAVELHPLTTMTTSVKTYKFFDNIFAGQYHGGVGEQAALGMAQRTTVSVTKSATSANISFRAGTIGNFTLLEIEIDRASIAGDGAGSFRMNANIVLSDGTTVPVRAATIAGTSMNATIDKARSGSKDQISLEVLALFSLSPESLLDAVNKSSGSAVSVQRPIQLILYGTPDDQ